MQQYRLFFFDGGGRLIKAHESVAQDDEQANWIAEGWREGRQMELWHRERKLRCWDFPAAIPAGRASSSS
jgi:hypothetical protein